MTYYRKLRSMSTLQSKPATLAANSHIRSARDGLLMLTCVTRISTRRKPERKPN
jgi:hypothetical protein